MNVPAPSKILTPANVVAQPPAPIASVEEIVAELRAGHMVILVDAPDRENEGDLILAADHVTPEAINFMVRFGRGVVCLSLSREHCERLCLPQMTANNRTRMGTAFTVSIEAAEGVTTGISAADRARTVQAAVAPNARAEDLVQPGHVFPLQAVDGGVLMRAGHTEAGCDLATMAGCTPAAVICEVMKDDGTMARLPDLQRFAAEHGLKIGAIADLIEYRSRTETLIERVGERPLRTAQGQFMVRAYRDKVNGALHLALVLGTWQPDAVVPVRVHEPLSILDVLDQGRSDHSWSIDAALSHIRQAGHGVAVLLNCGESADQLLAQFQSKLHANKVQAIQNDQIDLRRYGIGAQILRDCGVQRMQVLGTPLRLPGMAGGYGLEVTSYLAQPYDASQQEAAA